MKMKKFNLEYTELASIQFMQLEKTKRAQYKAVGKALAYMEQNIRHPSLHTHEYSKLSQATGYKVFESYAQNNTPGAYRIFWRYGPSKDTITILAITPHP